MARTYYLKSEVTANTDGRYGIELDVSSEISDLYMVTPAGTMCIAIDTIRLLETLKMIVEDNIENID